MDSLEKQLVLELKIAEMRIKELHLIRRLEQLEREVGEIGEGEEDEIKNKKEQVQEAKTCLDHVHNELQAHLQSLEVEETAAAVPAHPLQVLTMTKRVKQEQLAPPEQSQVRPHVNHSASRTLAKPQTFKKGDDICMFLERFQQFVKLSRMEDPDLDLFLLNLVQDDTTFKKLRNIELTFEQKSDVKKLVAAIKESLYPVTESRILRSTLANLKQQERESIESFAARIDDTATKAFSDIILREEASISTLIAGISDVQIRQKLLEADVDKFEHATRRAVKLELISAATVGTTFSEGHESEELGLPVYVLNNTSNSAPRDRQNSTFNAFNCQQCNKRHRTEDCWRDLICETCSMRGHPARVCRRALGPVEPAHGPRNAPRDTRASHVTCFRCWQKGHYARQCTSTNPQQFNSSQHYNNAPQHNSSQHYNNTPQHNGSQRQISTPQHGGFQQQNTTAQQGQAARSEEQESYLNGFAAAGNPAHSRPAGQ